MGQQVTLPDDLIRRVDAIVGTDGRAQFVADVLEAALRRRLIEALDALTGSLADVDVPGWETPESTTEWVHNLRYHPERIASPVGSGND